MKTLAYTLKTKGLLLLSVLFFFHTPLHAAVFTVSNLNGAGSGSYMQAIIDANALPGADVIEFTVSGTIIFGSPIPAITDTLHIDGTSAPGYVACGLPMITLDGSFGGAGNGIQLLGGASGSFVEAINIRNFQLNGIMLIGVDNCHVRACTIGVNSSALSATPNNGNGIQIEGGADYNLIGGQNPCDGNLISGNDGYGVSVNGSLHNDVCGNIIGLDITGSSAIANLGGGVLAVNNSHYTTVGGALINERNVISGNGLGLTGNGISIDGSVGCTIRGNYIGLDETGAFGIGNAENGISLNNASFTLLGGSGIHAGNVVSDHNFHAIVLNNGSHDCHITGNKCGTNAAGNAVIPNDYSGLIVINSNSPQIGQNANFPPNIFAGSASEYGIFLINCSSPGIVGNCIGTDTTGTLDLGNFAGGIRFDFGGGNTTIGGTFPSLANTIAFNGGYGIGILNANTNGVGIRQNKIYCNNGKGIDLAGVGNNTTPAPVITNATPTGCSGTAIPNSTVELFYDSTCTAFCQGKTYIATVFSDGTGNWSYPAALAPGTVTATVTPNGNHTSEFATCTLISCTPSTSTVLATACGSYVSPSGNVWTSSNTYQDTLQNSSGCDSIITINLTVNPISVTTDVITTCQSYTWIDGNTYTTSNNVATVTLTNASGCDSIISLDLTVFNPTTATDVITTCDSIYTWIDGNTYTANNTTATYTTTNSAGCDSIITLNLTLSSTPLISLQPFVDVCSNAGIVNLVGASPPGGTYSGLGVNGNTFDPSIAGVGTVSITYNYTDPNGCMGSVTEPLTVIPSTNPTQTAFGDVCNTDVSFSLTGGNPSGGSYSGTGVSNNMFDPFVAGPGVHTIVYSYTDMNNCTGTASQNITVNDCLKLEEFDVLELRILPNPAKNQFVIHSDAPWSLVQLLDPRGSLIQTFDTTSNTFDISGLPTGVYIVRVSVYDQWIQKRLIIE